MPGVVLYLVPGTSTVKRVDQYLILLKMAQLGLKTDTILSALCRTSKAFTLSVANCEPPLDCVRRPSMALPLSRTLFVSIYFDPIYNTKLKLSFKEKK